MYDNKETENARVGGVRDIKHGVKRGEEIPYTC